MKKLETSASGGLGAWLQFWILRLMGLISAAIHYRGMQSATWVLARYFKRDNTTVVRLRDGSRLEIHLSDGYWTRLLAPGYRYEPELERAMLGRVEAGADFLDLGANIGYWTVRASQFPAVGPDQVACVEATPSTFEQLVRNLRLNDIEPGRARLAAVWNTDGDVARIVSHERRHAGNSIVDREERIGDNRYQVHEIPTVTIDALVADFFPDASRPLVVKLDIEGAEIPALEGGSRVIEEREVAIFYEDHGQDPDCKVSARLLEMGMSLYSEDGAISLDQIKATKVDPAQGYNFIARNRVPA